MRTTFSGRLVRIAAIVAALAIAFAAVPAFAVGASVLTSRGPVPTQATIGGTPLFGMTEDQVRSLIASNTTLPVLPVLQVTASGRAFSFAATQAVVIDYSAMLDQAYNSTETATFELVPRFTVRAVVISGWVTRVARAVDKPVVNALYQLSSGHVRVVKAVPGRALVRASAASALRTRIYASIASTDTTTAAIPLRVVVVAPKVTVKNMGKAILVDLSERRITLFNGPTIEKRYRCAVGMHAYPTPTGSFRIVRKVKFPTWHNPGSDWAHDMPAYIGPGPHNPLGTRALYLNTGGIRIHGTSKRWSIGSAASHGCMRMLRENIEDLYNRVPVGTPVFIVP